MEEWSGQRRARWGAVRFGNIATTLATTPWGMHLPRDNPFCSPVDMGLSAGDTLRIRESRGLTRWWPRRTTSGPASRRGSRGVGASPTARVVTIFPNLTSPHLARHCPLHSSTPPLPPLLPAYGSLAARQARLRRSQGRPPIVLRCIRWDTRYILLFSQLRANISGLQIARGCSRCWTNPDNSSRGFLVIYSLFWSKIGILK